jgi:outer membrane phospholipase A
MLRTLTRWCAASIAALIALACLTAARAATFAVQAPTTAVSAGMTATIELIALNPDGATTHLLPDALEGRLVDGDRSWDVSLRPERAGIELPAGGFSRVRLTLMVPADASGLLVLELLQPQRLRTVLDVDPRPASVALPVRTPADLAGSEVVRQMTAVRPALTQLQRYYADHFSPHEPMYFVFGDEEPAAKFQLSMKYRLLNDQGPLATRLPLLKGLHVAYTQRSLWAITAVSSPFFDTSYMPELIFQSLKRDVRPRGGLRWIGWQAAFQHESNGRDGAESRSLNYFYFRPMLALGDLQGWHLLLRPKFQVYAGDLGDENADIKGFRGYGEVRAVIGNGSRLAVSLLGRMGDRFEKGSLQVDVSYPTAFMTGNFAMYLQLQYWVGYGESLLDYNRRSEALRAGFSLAR